MGRTVSKAVSMARRTERHAVQEWKKHQHDCYRCHRAVLDTNYRTACDHGWELAKAAQAAHVERENAEQEVPDDNGAIQLVMF